MTRYRPRLKVGVAFDLTQHEYLKGIYEDECQDAVYMKAGQVGISELMISDALYMADMRNANCLYVFPTDTHVSDFSAARLGPAIDREVSPYLADIIRPATSEMRGADRVGLKRVRDRFLYFRGGKVSPDGRAPQLRSIDADAIFLDEYDEMDRRAPPIAEERLGHSQISHKRKASTPTYSGVGIHAEYMMSDQRAWHIQCLACGHRQAPTLDDLVIEADSLGRPIRWHQHDGRPFLACRKCGGELDRSGPGEWVAAYPTRAIHGYHISRLFVPYKDLSKIIGDKEAEKPTGLMSVDETTRQQVYNQALGIAYKSVMALSLTNEILDACRREYGFVNTPPTGRVCMGVDVGSLLHVTIREKMPDGSRALRFAAGVSDFSEVGRLMKLHQVKTCVIDALPETRTVRNFQAEYPRHRVWLAYYDRNERGTKDIKPIEWDTRESVADMDRTRSLDETLALFVSASAKGVGNTLPANARDIQDYYMQLKAPERRFRTGRDGNRVAVYVESGADHFCHSENYCNAAFTCPVAEGWGRGASG